MGLALALSAVRTLRQAQAVFIRSLRLVVRVSERLASELQNSKARSVVSPEERPHDADTLRERLTKSALQGSGLAPLASVRMAVRYRVGLVALTADSRRCRRLFSDKRCFAPRGWSEAVLDSLNDGVKK